MKTITLPLRLVIILFLMVFLNSCSNKDDDNPPPGPTVAELLVSKWYLYKKDYNGTVTLADACTGQTFLDFKSNGTFLSQEFDYDNAHICDHSPLENGGYTLSADETEIMVTGPFGDQTLKIGSINETEFVLVFSPTEIYTFKH